MNPIRSLASGAVAMSTAAALTIITMSLGACDNGPDRTEQATLLKADVEAQLQVIEQDWAGGRVTHTSVAVTPEEGSDRFLVSIEGMKFQPEPNAELTIGTVAYVLTPKDEKTFSVGDLKMAPEMPFSGPGDAAGKLAMNVKSFEGLWSRELKTFLKLNGEITDVVATENQGGDIRVQSIKLVGDSQDKGGGVFDMTGSMVLTGASAGETSGGKLTLGEMKVDAKYDSIKLQDYLSGMSKIQALTAGQVSAAETGTAAPAMSAEEQKQLADQMMLLAHSIKGADWTMTMADISFVEVGGESPFNLKKFDMAADMSGLDGDKAMITLLLAHEGLAIAAPEANTPLAQAVLPKQGKLSVKVTDIPTQALTNAIATGLPNAIGGGGATVEAGLAALGMSLQSVLSNSGIKIAIEPSGWSGEVTKVDAEGAFNVDPNSILGIIGTLNLVLHGLDDLLALAQANPDLPESQQVLGMGTMLSTMSNRGQGNDGKPVDQFKIDLTQQGEMLVNGKPMGM